MIKLNTDEYFKTIHLKLYPTKEQEDKLFEYNEITRQIHNWGIDMEELNYELYKEGKREYAVLTRFDFSRLYTKFMKTDDPLVNVFKKVPAHTALNALADVTDAYKMFLDGFNRYPSRHRRNSSFTTRYDRSYIKNGELHIEGFNSNIPLKTHLYDGYGGKLGLNGTIRKYYNVTILFNGLDFFVYFSIIDKKNLTRFKNVPQSEPIGIDLGLRKTFTLSNGKIFKQPDITRYKNRIKQLSTLISKIGEENIINSDGSINESLSNNMKKKVLQRKRDYKKIHNVLFTYYYNTINEIIATNPEAIVIETINKSRLRANNPYNKLLHNTYFYSIRIIMENMCNKYGISLYEVNESYPSTKICNNCKCIHEVGREEIFTCPSCGFSIDRDLNAALNLRDVYINKETENIKTAYNIKGTTIN